MSEGNIQGRRFEYGAQTIFYVKVGEKRASRYVTRHQTTGDAGQAIALYAKIALHGGAKKLLGIENPGGEFQILIREFS